MYRRRKKNVPTERFRHHEGLGHTVPGVGLQVRDRGGGHRERERERERGEREGREGGKRERGERERERDRQTDRQTGVGGVRSCCGEERKAVKDADQLNRL